MAQVEVRGVCGLALMLALAQACESGRVTDYRARAPSAQPGPAPRAAARARASASASASGSASAAAPKPALPCPSSALGSAKPPPDLTVPVEDASAAAARLPKAPAARQPKALAYRFHGTFDGAGVRGRGSLDGKELKLELTPIGAGPKLRLNGKLTDVLATTGRADLTLSVAGKKPPAVPNGWIVEASLLERFRGRLQVDATITEKQREQELKLWSYSRNDGGSYEPYRDSIYRRSEEPFDIHWAVEVSDRPTFVLTSDMSENRALSLWALNSAREVLTSYSAGVVCDHSECSASLGAFEVAPGQLLFLVTTSGEDCGAKCSQSASASLLSYRSDGFGPPIELDQTYSLMGGISYPSTTVTNALYWLELDGAAPLEILTKYEGENGPSFGVYVFNPKTNAYEARADTLAPECMSKLVEGTQSFADY
ncbi:MAG: hypothetical protein ACOY0T_03140 [Myxococcota bacterium]